MQASRAAERRVHNERSQRSSLGQRATARTRTLRLARYTDPVCRICRREGLSPTQVYQWRKTLMASGETLFVPKRKGAAEDPRLQRLQAENQRMKSVIAEITAENLDLKKTLSD